jgi:hypothetical protein
MSDECLEDLDAGFCPPRMVIVCDAAVAREFD